MKILSCFVTAIIVMGCSSRHVDTDELSGSWVAAAIDGKRNPLPVTLTARRDGTFEIANLPRAVFDSDGTHRTHVESSRGRWKPGESTEGQQVVDLTFEHAEGVKDRLPFGVRLFVTTSQGRPLLIYHLGDPDSDPQLNFEKQSTER